MNQQIDYIVENLYELVEDRDAQVIPAKNTGNTVIKTPENTQFFFGFE